jgi:nicotinate-nucleotide adenylyltransferase
VGAGRLGILGGMFNPPHLGHLVCAQEAHSQLGLDAVLFMPVAAPPHKEASEDPGAERRFELCRLAVRGDERFGVSRLEIERGGASYTVDTLTALHERHPEDELIFIAGGDVAASLPTWREPSRVLELAGFAVAERRGAVREDVIERWRALGDAAPAGPLFLDMPRIDVSSSEVRRRVRDGRPVRYLVPDPVVAYIEAHGLYRSAVASS